MTPESSLQTPEPLTIVYRDPDFLVIDKPTGLHVHQPEHPRRRVPRERTCLFRLGRQTGEYLYPVHRLDVATTGILMFALNKAAASTMGRLFTDGQVSKSYLAIARGYTDDEGVIDVPLPSDSTGEDAEAVTAYKTLARVELPHAVGRRHATARYSLVRVDPQTGRYHQIRRHFGRISHPLIGDCEHGDSHHNRFFRETLGLPGLWLRADRLSFTDPRTQRRYEFTAPLSSAWERALGHLGWLQERAAAN